MARFPIGPLILNQLLVYSGGQSRLSTVGPLGNSRAVISGKVFSGNPREEISQFLPSCHRIVAAPGADVHEGQDLVWNDLLKLSQPTHTPGASGHTKECVHVIPRIQGVVELHAVEPIPLRVVCVEGSSTLSDLTQRQRVMWTVCSHRYSNRRESKSRSLRFCASR
jgi:hypothetical protein